jgi:hypothetical protein
MAFFFMVGFVNGGYEATQMRIRMDNSPSIVGGSIFNLYNSLSNIGQIALGSILIAAFIEIVGDYRFGWQLDVLFLFATLILGLYLARILRDEAFTEEQKTMITPDMWRINACVFVSHGAVRIDLKNFAAPSSFSFSRVELFFGVSN